jgi:hypothetical protein
MGDEWRSLAKMKRMKDEKQESKKKIKTNTKTKIKNK